MATERRSEAKLMADWFRNLVGAFGDGWTVARALPWLALLMAGIEFAQHIVEVKVGFFSTDLATRKAASLDPVRMSFGWPKMFVVWGFAFVAIRWLMLRDARAALRPPAAAVRRYVWVVMFQLIPFVAILYAEPIVAAFGFGADAIVPVRAVFGLGQQLLEPLLCLWFVSAALGDGRHGPITSAMQTRSLYFWALPLIFLARLPVNGAHSLLNRYAAGQPPALMWAMLVLDALVVAGVVTVVAAAQVRAARYIATRRGITLGV